MGQEIMARILEPTMLRGQDGIGGLIWLAVGGDLTITGSIVSSGMASIGGGTGAGNTYAGGGGSGAAAK